MFHIKGSHLTPFFDILKKEQCIKASLAQLKKSVKIKMLLHDYEEIHIKQNRTQQIKSIILTLVFSTHT